MSALASSVSDAPNILTMLELLFMITICLKYRPLVYWKHKLNWKFMLSHVLFKQILLCLLSSIITIHLWGGGIHEYTAGSVKPGKSLWRERQGTFDLLVVTSLDYLLFILKLFCKNVNNSLNIKKSSSKLVKQLNIYWLVLIVCSPWHIEACHFSNLKVDCSVKM